MKIRCPHCQGTITPTRHQDPETALQRHIELSHTPAKAGTR